MLRRRNLFLVGLGLLVFLFISALLSRALSADGAERSAITALIQAEARGDGRGMLAEMSGCRRRPACRAAVGHDAASLARPGDVLILELNPSAGFSPTSTLGIARVAWKTPASLPIVQCIRVRRAGDVLAGLRVELLEIGPRIRSDATCPTG